MIKRGPLLSVKSSLQNKLVWVIFAAMAVPTLVLGGSLFVLISRITGASAVVSPQAALMEVAAYLGFSFPPLAALLLGWAFHRTNQIVGPIDRITRELDDHLAGKGNGLLKLRPGDQIVPLVDRINRLLEERAAQNADSRSSLGGREPKASPDGVSP